MFRKITGFFQEVSALSRCLVSVTYITLTGEHSMYRGRDTQQGYRWFTGNSKGRDL